MLFQNVFKQVFILFIIMLIGIAAKKLNAVSDRFEKDLADFILNVSLPAMLIEAMNFEFSAERLRNGGMVVLLGAITMLASAAFGVLLTKLLRIKSPKRNIYQYMIIFSNVGFMGIPVIEAIYGSAGAFYAALYNIPFDVLVWTLGVIVMDGADGGKISPKDLLNPGLIATAVGFIMFAFSIRLPGALSEALNLVGGVTTPLSMLLIGFILAGSGIKETFANPIIYLMSLIRLLAIPLVCFITFRLFVADGILLGSLVIMPAMPAAANTAIFASKYRGDTGTASQCIFVSTLLSAVTIPLVIYLMGVI